MQGKVKWFSKEKGYGFIGSDDGDVFVHYSQVQMEGYKELKENQLVEFEVIQSPKGPQAQDVKILDSGKTDEASPAKHEGDESEG